MSMRIQVLGLAILCVLAVSISADASGISYTIVSTESGTIGGQTFTNATVTMNVSGDTSRVGSLMNGGLFFNPVNGTVTISSLGGPFTFQNPIEMFSTGDVLLGGSFQNTPAVLLGQLDPPGNNPGQITGIAGTVTTSLFGYDLQGATTATGQAAQPATSGQFLTSGGVLHFTSATGSSTFTATGGNGAVYSGPGGTDANPVTLTTPTSQISGTIGGNVLQEFYLFSWPGGPFSAMGSVGTTDPTLSYDFNLALLSTVLQGTVLNGADHWTQTVSLDNLAAGTYEIGLAQHGAADPPFTINFATTVATPEPATLTLTGIGVGLSGAFARYRRSPTRTT
jgi:hypothetical protein